MAHVSDQQQSSFPIAAASSANIAQRGAGTSGSIQPPALPSGSVYTSCYCEENVYLLAEAFSARKDADIGWPWDIYIVFISNPGKTVALWQQKAREDVVVWDYHVVLVLRAQTPSRSEVRTRGARADDKSDGTPSQQTWVYDFDTRLPLPCPWLGESMCHLVPRIRA